MDKINIIKSISERGNGDIYLGVVGAVRCGKSTFIKRFMENLVIPNIVDSNEKKRALDEIPQSSGGKTIMTSEPKFIPSTSCKISLDDFSCNVRLVDCVGYVIKGALGYQDENGPRMVKTPWYDEDIPFVEAAEVGTEKVIREHSTIGILMTSDGSFGEFDRSDYISSEERIADELKSIGKPFVIILNSSHPMMPETESIASSLHDKYGVPVLPINVDNMGERECMDILKEALYEFPVISIDVEMPDWIAVLPKDNLIKKEYISFIKKSVVDIDKVRDASNIIASFEESDVISRATLCDVDTSLGIIRIRLDAPDGLFERELKEICNVDLSSKASLINLLCEYSEIKEEYGGIRDALRMAKNTGYGVASPSLSDMKLGKPEIIKHGSRYGIKLRASAPSIHMIRVDVESTFEPIIGSEMQSKELISHLVHDREDKSNIWKSEIFGRSLDEIVQEGIQAKLSIMPENVRFKLRNTLNRVVNKGSNNLIAIVI